MSELFKQKLPVLGLATGPNDLDKPTGGFLVAENVVHRRTGILEPLKGEQAIYGEDVGTVVRVFADWAPDYHLWIKQDADYVGRLTYYNIDGGETIDSFPVAAFQPGETQAVYADRRHIFSGAQFVTVIDNTDPTQFEYPRRAGLARPLYIEWVGSTTTTAGQAVTVPANKFCAWVAIGRRVISGHERELNSAPCSPVRNTLTGADQSVTLRVHIPLLFDDSGDDSAQCYVEGDKIVLYRTVAFDSFPELNGVYYRSTEHALTATDIANGYADILDSTSDDYLGELLYTNAGNQGSLKENRIPPAAAGVETYNGTTFYINKHAQPTLTLQTKGPFGALPTGINDATRQQRKNGVGLRRFVGNVTNGSTFITAVSADDRLGLAVGQIVEHTWLAAPSTIVAILGAGPYTVQLADAANNTAAALTIDAFDTMRVQNIHPTSGFQSSDTFAIGGPIAMQEGLAAMVDTFSSDPMRGFYAVASNAVDFAVDTITDDQVSINVSVLAPDQSDRFVVFVTNPDNWVNSDHDNSFTTHKSIESVQDDRRNVLWYSKPNLPEDVAPIQFLLIGNDRLLRIVNAQSCMLAFCTDGVFKIDGEGDNWFITLVESSARLVHPDCVVTSNETAFAWLTTGLAAATETSTQVISHDAIGPALVSAVPDLTAAAESAGREVRELWGPNMALDRLNNDVRLTITQVFEDFSAPVLFGGYLFNLRTTQFTSCGEAYTAMCYAQAQQYLITALTGALLRPSVESGDYKPATVLYTIADNSEMVKQWFDVNLFLDNVPAGLDGVEYVLEALFGGELTSSTNEITVNATEPTRLFAAHAVVPRRVARGVELIFGFHSRVDADPEHESGGFYFQFKGAAVRARVSSQIIKR